jgi:hypothetical protein
MAPPDRPCERGHDLRVRRLAAAEYDRYGTNERFVAFSPDGSKFATVVWRGDLAQDVNVYDLLVFEVDEALSGLRRTPAPIRSVPFRGDSVDQAATPIDQLSFLGDNRTVAFLGTLAGEPRQVYAVDSHTGQLRTLTRHPTAVVAYADDDGRVRLYAATAPDDSARMQTAPARRRLPVGRVDLVATFLVGGILFGGVAYRARGPEPSPPALDP